MMTNFLFLDKLFL